MSTADRERWNRRYAEGAYAAREYPTALLAQRLPAWPRGRALDVACGAGRNALYLAEHGFEVDALDISSVALERLAQAARERRLAVHTIEADLEAADHDADAALPPGPYALIIVVRYVHRQLLPALLRRLAPGGLLFVEQHVDSAEEVVGPRTRAFRYRPDELLREALAASESGDTVLEYHENTVQDPDGRRAALARLLLRRGAG